MHVGYVLKRFPRISETFILNEILELQRQGAQVTVFSLHAPDDGFFHRKLADLSNPVVYLRQRKPRALLEYLGEHVDLLKESGPDLLAQLEMLLREQRTDTWSVLRWGTEIAIQARQRNVQHFHAHFATVASYTTRVANAVSGVPYSITCHAKDIYREGIDPLAFQSLTSPASFLVTVCDANSKHITENLLQGPKVPVMTLYNGIDLEQFHPRNRKPDTMPLILGIGRLVEKKGFPYLIEAAGSLLRAGNKLRCVIVGEGDQRSALEELIRAQSVDGIELYGLRVQDEVQDLISRATMVVLPCVIGEDGNRDALPTCLLEAMGSGTPVISTPIVGVEEIVDGGRAGILAPVADAAGLQNEIARLLHDENLRNDLARAGREQAERCFDLQKSVATLLHWFKNGVAEAGVRS